MDDIRIDKSSWRWKGKKKAEQKDKRINKRVAEIDESTKKERMIKNRGNIRM